MSLSPLGFNSAVSQYPNTTAVAPQNTVDSTKSFSNVFANKVLAETNSYQNDIMMAGIDFKGLAEQMNNPMVAPSVQSQVCADSSLNQPVSKNNISFSGNTQQPILENNKEPVTRVVKKEQPVVKDVSSNSDPDSIIPIIGGVLGATTPLVCNYVHTGKLLSKNLFIKMPIMAVGGICIAGIIKGLAVSLKKLKAPVDNEAMIALNGSVNQMDVKA